MLLLLACTPSKVAPDPAPGVGEDSPEQVGGETGQDTDETTDETTDESACSDLYDADVLPEFEIDVDRQVWEQIVAEFHSYDDSKPYHPVVFRYGTEERADAKIRLKGNPGFSWFGDKMQFVISFNEENAEARFHGVRKIALDASWYEPTQLKDRVSWRIMRGREGLPSACANNAKLTVNGEYYGLYTNIEYYDHEWLERNFGDDAADGNLWKYGTELKTNEETGSDDVIDRLWRTTDLATLEGLGDVTEWTREWAAEAVLGDDDGYWCCAHNFYLYEHPTQGVLFVPWDFDDNFDVQGYDVDPIEGYHPALFQQPTYRAVLADPAWRAVYVDEIEAMNALLDPDAVLADIDVWQAQIDAAVEADPQRSIGWEEHLEGIDRLRAWIVARHAYLKSWVGCERGTGADADADGYPVCSDPNDADPAVNPAATEICNGIDDDADGWIDDDPSCDDCARHDFEDRHFLYCRWPRTHDDAEAACVARGGTLAVPESTPEVYMAYFHTWPVLGPWWMGATDTAREGAWVDAAGDDVERSAYWAGGQPDGGPDEDCLSWDVDVSGQGWADADCGDPHPSICVIP